MLCLQEVHPDTVTPTHQEEREEAAQARAQRRQGGADTGVTVSDADMAVQLGAQAQVRQKPDLKGHGAFGKGSDSGWG